MFCPSCGQQQVSNETRFCSRCGFLLSDIAEVVANKGISPYKTPGRARKKDSPRKRGLKQGGMIMLVGCLLVVPVISILMPFLNFPVFVVPIAAVLSFMGGLLRMIYAWMFEEKEEFAFEQDYPNQNIIGDKTSNNALPPPQSIPVSDFVPPPGSWQTTNNLVQPPSVTEHTTKILKKEE